MLHKAYVCSGKLDCSVYKGNIDYLIMTLSISMLSTSIICIQCYKRKYRLSYYAFKGNIHFPTNFSLVCI